jgi:outer membrane protein
MTGRSQIFLIFLAVVAGAPPVRAQNADSLPAVPASPGTVHAALPPALLPPGPPFQVPGAQASTAQPGPIPAVQKLSLPEAEKIALQSHPEIQIAQHRAVSAAAQVKQVQSLYFPQTNGSLTGVVAETNSRIDSGGLNNPIIFNRFAYGVFFSQYITDFGRTQALVRSSSEHARAREAVVVTSRADVLLQLHEAYFAALRSKAVLTVAQETVKDRQLISDQVGVMAKNQLKSGLDVAFANVDLAQAQLLLIQAQNDLQASYAQFSAALGSREQTAYDLDEMPVPAAPPAEFSAVLQEAFQNRPELAGQRLEVSSARSFATAQRDLWFPSLTAAGAAGLTPYRNDQLAPRYSAVGFNVNIPLFNGHLFGSLRTQASEEYRAQQQFLRDLEDRIARDVRTAWLNAGSAFQRLSVTEQLLNEARLAEDLASSRYRMGLSSIIEVSQAQLNLTQAQIAEASAKYEYQARISELLYQQGLLR